MGGMHYIIDKCDEQTMWRQDDASSISLALCFLKFSHLHGVAGGKQKRGSWLNCVEVYFGKLGWP